jgi:hypothetical protein
MNRTEFDELLGIPNKRVLGDIRFIQGGAGPILQFQGISVENSLGWEISLNGSYNPLTGFIKFNFVAKGVGPICRVCVKGKVHNGSRTHKHDLRYETCPTQNLPYTIDRPDLENMNARQVWDDLCRRANLVHDGQFFDPDLVLNHN